MASYLVNQHECEGFDQPITAQELWRHYEKTRFLYSAKLEVLQPHKQRILDLWERLLAAPPDVYQIHYARKHGEVVSSLSGFRDTSQRFVIQHAASLSHPETLVECLLSHTSSVSTARVAALCMVYRPENKWPGRLKRTIGSLQPLHLQSLCERRYFSAVPGPVRWPTNVRCVTGGVDQPVLEVLVEELGILHTESLGWFHVPGEFHLPQYDMAGLRRSSHLLAYEHQGECLGAASVHMGDGPLNLSFLCTRVELAVAEQQPAQKEITQALLEAARCLFNENGTPRFYALLKDWHGEGAVAAGFLDAGRRYSTWVWAKERERGYPSTSIALSKLYSLISGRSKSDRSLCPPDSKAVLAANS